MSQENVEVAKQALEAFRQDDIDRFLSYIHPEVEWYPRLSELEGTHHHGHDGVRRWWAGSFEAFPDWRPTITEVRDLDDFVLLHAPAVGSGAGSGAGVEQDVWQVAQIEGGRIVWYRACRTEQEALEAVGLRE